MLVSCFDTDVETNNSVFLIHKTYIWLIEYEVFLSFFCPQTKSFQTKLMDTLLKRFLFYSHIVATLASLVAGPVEHMDMIGICDQGSTY